VRRMSAPAVLPQRRILGLIFLTVFMDIVGFAVVIPMFPSLLEHYLRTEGAAGSLVTAMVDAARWLAGGEPRPALVAVLFGGVLSTLFSTLQFIFSPIWGGLSDRIGRRPVLLGTLAGNALSYALWVVSGEFWVFVISRLLCGMSAGNIAVASAAAADVTDRANRTKGMAVVGVAIGLGFHVGPVIGGLASLWVLPHDPQPGPLGLNPFSGAAIVSACLAALNLLLVWRFFPETLRVADRAAEARPTVFALARVGDGGVRRASLANLLYQVAFTGMETTVVFLTAALFLFTPADNAWLFLANGLCLILAQGLAGRFLGRRIGERAVARIGFAIGAVALGAIALIPYPAPGAPALSHLIVPFFAATGLLAFSTGLILPSLSSLVSLYSHPDEQGRNLGILRSAGALARIFGPMAAAYAFFHTGTHQWVYLAGALLLLPGFWMVGRLPAPSASANGQG